MKNLKHSVACLLMLVMFGPVYGLAFLGGEPVYSRGTGTFQNQKNAVTAEESDASRQPGNNGTRQQSAANHEPKGCTDQEKAICLDDQ